MAAPTKSHPGGTVVADRPNANPYRPEQSLSTDRPIPEPFTGSKYADPPGPLPVPQSASYGEPITVALAPSVSDEVRIVAAMAGVSVEGLVAWAIGDACSRIRAGRGAS